jgi:hypothetical protein
MMASVILLEDTKPLKHITLTCSDGDEDMGMMLSQDVLGMKMPS